MNKTKPLPPLTSAILAAVLILVGLSSLVSTLLFYPLLVPKLEQVIQTNIIPYENIDLIETGTDADARVTKITEESNCILGMIKGEITSTYYYVCDYGQIEFNVNGETYNAVLRTNSDPKPKLNDTIKILYNPADPQKVLVKDENFTSDYLKRQVTNHLNFDSLIHILTLMGIIFLICGIFIFIKGIKSAPLSLGENPKP